MERAARIFLAQLIVYLVDELLESRAMGASALHRARHEQNTQGRPREHDCR